MTEETMTRIVVVDDHPMYRKALTALLRDQPGCEVVAEADNGVDAVAATGRTQPDVVLMDLAIPALNGIDATRQIVASSPHIAVLVLTMYDDDE